MGRNSAFFHLRRQGGGMQLSRYSGDLSTVDFVDLLIVDLSGALRSISLPRPYMAEGRMESGIGVDAETFGFVDPTGVRLSAQPDLSSAFVEEKEGIRTLHVLCDLEDESGRDFPQAPRQVARAALAELRASGLADDAMMLPELEFFAFDDVRYATGIGRSYYMVESSEGIGAEREDLPRFRPTRGGMGLAPEDRFDLLRSKAVLALEAAGIPVKYHHHEGAVSQLEIELDFASLPRAADSIVLSKWIIKSCARELDLFATFMPKPIQGVAGSGLHIHQYLAKDGASLFPGAGPCGLSPLALSYSAGILEHSISGSLLAWSNPSTNSYRRLLAGSGAPTCAAIAQSSRSAAIRVPGYLRTGEERVEFRPGDATCNPHYFLSAMLLAGLDGARRGLDPAAMGLLESHPESAPGRAPSAGPDGRLPAELALALGGIKSDSGYLRSVFPPSLVDAWIEAKEADAAYVRAAPVPQEYELYF
jgi:glutamine synthetase